MVAVDIRITKHMNFYKKSQSNHNQIKLYVASRRCINPLMIIRVNLYLNIPSLLLSDEFVIQFNVLQCVNFLFCKNIMFGESNVFISSFNWLTATHFKPHVNLDF